MADIPVSQVRVLTGKTGMRAFMEAFVNPGIRAKAVVETAEDENRKPFVLCSVGHVKAGMSADEARSFADAFENAANSKHPGGHSPVTELCMLIREAASRAEKWSQK